MQAIFGLGTGGCGTVSLMQLLNDQSDTQISHEMRPHLPWVVDSDIFNQHMDRILGRAAEFVGDVSFYLLPYVGAIQQCFPGAKFICLQRKRGPCIESLVGKMRSVKLNCYQTGNQGDCRVAPNAARQLPKYDDGLDMRSAIGRYYDDYYAIARTHARTAPHLFRIFPLDCLNSIAGAESILLFAGFNNRKVSVGIWENRRQ